MPDHKCSEPIALLSSQVRIGKNILVGTMANALHCYDGKGHKYYSLYLPSPILTMQLLATHTSRLTKCVIVALANGKVS